MTEAQLIHEMARTHWWTRTQHRMQVEATEILLGADDPRAIQAAARIDAEWEKVKDRETRAMQVTLSGITLFDSLR